MTKDKSFLLGQAIINCSIPTVVISGVIDFFLYQDGKNFGDVGMEILIGAAITSFLCSFIFYCMYNSKKCGSAPKMQGTVKKHRLYRWFSGHSLPDCLIMTILSTILFGALPCLVMKLLFSAVPAEKLAFMVVKAVCAGCYTTFSVYHIMHYRILHHQKSE